MNWIVTVTLLLGGTTTGFPVVGFGLTTAKICELLELIERMLNGMLPQLVTVNVCVSVWPAQTSPKLIVFRDNSQHTRAQKALTLTVPQLTGPQMLLATTVIVPICSPGVVQVNRMVTVALPPGGIVNGGVGLTTVKAGLLEVMALMIKSTLPQLVTMKVCVTLRSGHTVPKSISRGDTSQQGWAQKPVTITVPQSTGPLGLSVTSRIVPLCCPGATQINPIVTVTLLPGGTVTGPVGFSTTNAGLLEVMAVMVNGIRPQLVTVKVCVAA